MWREADPFQQAQWPEQHESLRQKLEASLKVFKPRVLELNAEGCEPEEARG